MSTTRRIAADLSVVASTEAHLFEEIFQFFKSQLVSGVLRPGDRLLSERELATRLGVSRTSLREVMRAMALLGVVEIRPGQGTFVRSPDVGVLRDFFGVMLAMQPTVYEHVLEARIAIECHAIRLACTNARPEDEARLHLALDRILETVEDPDVGADADFEFHAAIVQASRNAVLLFVYEAIETLLRRSHHERRAAIIGRPDVLVTLGEAHRRVLDAILGRDPDRAEAVLREHFDLARNARGRT
ncbi:MAG TPA: FadR/GntR family transcriptional regulator [Thermodesulfobacteriota bacterium]